MSDQETIAVPLSLIEYASRELYLKPSDCDSLDLEKTPDGSLRKGWAFTLLEKETLTDKDGQSRQATNTGTQAHPFNMAAVKQFLTSNEHHSTCIQTKVAATVGLGFQTERDRKKKDLADGADPAATIIDRTKDWEPTEVDTRLDPLTEYSFQDVLSCVAEDYHQLNISAMEVVRRGGGEITGLHYQPFEQVRIFVEDQFYNFHYEIDSVEGITRRFARFSDRENFIKRSKAQSGASFRIEDQNEDSISELIVFRKPSSLNRWYPIPKWLSCTATIELVQMLTQHEFDFFLNRCTPEFMLFIMGAKLIKEDWDKVINALKAGIGVGNSHKSFALNLTNPDIKVQLEKLAAESGKEDAWASKNEACALKIVTAHQVPPLLAGIQIPGKLGANNELPNALMSFQALVVGQDQRIFERTLVQTLGKELGIDPKNFLLRTILDEIDINQADTMSRMRQTLPEAQKQGRDLRSGVKD